MDSGEPNFASWNQSNGWLRQVEGLRAEATLMLGIRIGAGASRAQGVT